jgi:hypothetical protein
MEWSTGTTTACCTPPATMFHQLSTNNFTTDRSPRRQTSSRHNRASTKPGAVQNVLDRHAWATREQLRIEIVRWVERTYHRRRRQALSGG